MARSSVKWKLLLSTPDEVEAYDLKTRLESEGVTCRLESDNTFPSTVGNGLAREWRVYVPLADFEASVQVVDADMDEEV